MSDYDPRFNYPSSLSYPVPPGGHYPPPSNGGYHGPPPYGQYPPPPGGYYPPTPFGHNPLSPEEQCPSPAGSSPYPTAPPHDPNDVVPVPVPGPRSHYPELPQTYYPPPPHYSSSSSSSSPSSTTSSNHSRSNYANGSGYYWIDWTSDRGVPRTAVAGGTDIDGAQIYVGRAYHEGDWIPAKVIPDRQVAYVAYGGGEHAKHKFQVLCEQRFDWVPSSGGQIPYGAVEGGRTSDGEILYIGRVWHDGAHTVGKIHPSHRCLYIPFDCKEMSFPEYEVLVLRT